MFNTEESLALFTILAARGKGLRLKGTVAAENGKRSLQKNSYVEPETLIADIAQVHADHFIECSAAAAIHLPRSGDPRFCFKNPSAVPERILFKFIGYRRPGSNKGHVSAKNVNELRQFVQTALAEKPAYPRDSGIVLDLIGSIGITYFLFDQPPNVFLVNRRVTVHVHRTELQKVELLAELADTL